MSSESFEYIPVSDWEVISVETSGRREKYWLRKPKTREAWLLKPVTVKRGLVHGEHWAEKAAAHLADLLGVPHALVELAYRYNMQGSMALDLRPESFELQEGSVLLGRFADFVHQEGRAGSHSGHTLEHIVDVLSDVEPPLGWEAAFRATAFDVFAGYLTFDAWIANSDRHDENWAVMRHASKPTLYLSASYDHSSSLGWNVPDAKRIERLADPKLMAQWCQRGRATGFERTEGQPTVTLVDMAAKALGMASSAARSYWLDMLDRVTSSDTREVFGCASIL